MKAVLAGILTSLVLAAPASAAPELFVRMQTWDTHEPASDWIPLASAPSLNYLGGYEIGYRLETTGFQQVSLTVNAVPDGRPTQASPYCVGQNGTAGDIKPAGPELQFEGSGTYTITVTICTSGSSSSGTFGVDAPVTPSVVGTPQTFRVKPLAGDAVVGSGPNVPEHVFTRPGDWTCVARGTVEGRDDNLDLTEFATPWSAPLAVGVGSDFQRRLGVVSRPRAKRPRFTFTAEWPALAVGGRATITLSRVTGCRGRRYKLRRVATYRGQFGARNLRVTMRRPRRGFFIARFAFAGTRLLRAGVDPNPMLLTVQRGRMGFVDPRGFPRCP